MRLLRAASAAAAVSLVLISPRQAAPQSTKKAAEKPGARHGAASGLPVFTLREMIAQMVMAPYYGDSPHVRTRAYREYAALVQELRVGGFLVLNRVQGGVAVKAEPYATAAFLNRMQRLAKVPLWVGGDFERGASMRMRGTPAYPHAMAFGAAGDPALTRALGRATAREARAMGVHWVFAPVADVNNNPANPVIGVRSFGEDPEMVARHVKAFIEGAHSEPLHKVLVTVKHFPGHGDTAVDSHLGLASVEAPLERLQAVEFVPFRAAIATGVDAVMTGHLGVPALDASGDPATVSAAILTGLLRQRMQFGGLISTDALDMHALTRSFPPGEAAVRAVLAGADVLLAPPNPREAVRAVAAAVESGRIPRARIQQSFTRILAAKSNLGLTTRRYTRLEEMEDLLNSPEDDELARTAATRAVTLIKNEGGMLPLRKPASACWLALSGSRFSGTGRRLVEEIKLREPAARIFHLDPQAAPEELRGIAEGLQSCECIVAAAYSMPVAFQNGASLPGNYPAFLDQLLSGGSPVVLVSLGNPYLLQSYPRAAAYVAAYSPVEPMEEAVVKALFGENPMPGRLPVTLPGVAPFGAGLAQAIPADAIFAGATAPGSARQVSHTTQ